MDGPSPTSFAGVYTSSSIGFTYAPMDRDCKFEEDGTGWLSVAFVGPELTFHWRQLDSQRIEVWMPDEPNERQLLEISRNGNEILLTRPDEDLETVLKAPVDRLVDALEFEPLVRVR